MSKVIAVRLEWKFSPETYLEEPLSIEFEDVKLEMKDGVAIATITPETFLANESIRYELTRQIENRLLTIQLMTHKAFELSKPTRTDVREDGKKSYFLEAEGSVMTLSFGTVDTLIHDKDGNIVSDTKAERLDKQHAFFTLVDRHREHDATLGHMLKSYQQSVNNPENELVYLYEIRDALALKFGSKDDAIKTLGVTKTDWDKIGKIANTLPLKQGRHRGQSVGALRDADPTELKMARESVVHLINQYLNFLETQLPPKKSLSL